MSRFSSLLLLCIISFATAAPAQSGKKWGSGIDFTQRAANREKGRFSLTDWMAMKDRNRMMDQWLALNSAPTNFEFSLGGSYNSYKTEVSGVTGDTSHISYRGEASAYAQIVGLTAEYENNTDEGLNDLSGLFNLRVFGNSIQTTSLTLHYGQRTRDQSTGKLTQQLGQATLQLYITKFFGLAGNYRYYLPTSTTELGDVKGDSSEAGVFIDFNALRVFGNYYQESQKTRIPAATDDTVTNRSGIRTGIKIFF